MIKILSGEKLKEVYYSLQFQKGRVHYDRKKDTAAGMEDTVAETGGFPVTLCPHYSGNSEQIAGSVYNT